MKRTVWDFIEAKTGRPHEEVLVELLNKHQEYKGVAEELGCSAATVSVKVIEIINTRTVYELKPEAKAAIKARKAEVQA